MFFSEESKEYAVIAIAPSVTKLISRVTEIEIIVRDQTGII